MILQNLLDFIKTYDSASDSTSSGNTDLVIIPHPGSDVTPELVEDDDSTKEMLKVFIERFQDANLIGLSKANSISSQNRHSSFMHKAITKYSYKPNLDIDPAELEKTQCVSCKGFGYFSYECAKDCFR